MARLLKLNNYMAITLTAEQFKQRYGKEGMAKFDVGQTISAEELQKRYAPPKEPGLFSRIKESLGEKLKSAKETYTSYRESKKGLVRGAEAGLQYAGSVTGALGDVIGVPLSYAEEKISKAIPEDVKRVLEVSFPIFAVNEKVKNEAYKYLGMGIQKWNEWKGKSSENARIGKDIESAINVGTLIPIGKGAQLAGKEAGLAAKSELLAAKSLAKKTVEKVVERAPQISLEEARNSVSARIINSLIKPLSKDLSYGKNPGRGVASEGLVFNSLEEGAKVITDRKNEIGKAIGQSLKNKPEVKIDVTQSLSPLDDAMAEAVKGGKVNESLISRIKDVKDSLTGNYDIVDGQVTRISDKKLVDLTPEEAFNLKRDVAGLTKYTGNASDDTTINRALQKVYTNVKNQLNEVDPNIKQLNERFADLSSAEVAIKYRDLIAQRQNIVSFAPKLAGYGLGGLGIITMNPAAIAGAVLSFGVDRLFGSAAFKTRLASWLSSAKPVEINQLLQLVPEIKPYLENIKRKTPLKPKK